MLTTDIHIGVGHKSYDLGEYIGRGRNSPLGNPFRTKARNYDEHARVVALYRTWLWDKIQTKDRPVCNELNRLKAIAMKRGHVELLCWCRKLTSLNRLPCHGDIIGRCLHWMIENDITL